MKNKRGWIRIIEVFIAILLITGILLIVLDKEEGLEKDISSKIYKAEVSILREIQLNNSLREDILDLDVTNPVEWEGEYFPSNVKSKITSRTPNYLTCKAKICSLDSVCDLSESSEDDIYAQSAVISANLQKYDPRQLKLFCWTD